MSRSRCVTRSGNIDQEAIAVLSAPTAAYADLVEPQQDTACSPDLANAMTWLPEQKIMDPN
jgi:hypothetical protein